MSDRLTEASVPSMFGTGLAMQGRLTRADMINDYRAYWTRQLERAQAVLATPDDQIKVATYIGPYARHKYEELLP